MQKLILPLLLAASCFAQQAVRYTGQPGALPIAIPAAATGTVSSVSGSGPSWLTWSIATATTTPAITLSPTTAQTSHQVIGTCNAATTFAPCALVAGDLPATLSSGTAITSAALTTAVITTDVHCVSAGGCTIGTAALPASSVYIGGAATNNIRVTGTSAAARVATIPDVAADSTFALAATSTTTTQVLHAGATAGLGVYSNVAVADFGSSITARAALNNATSAAAAPTFSTTVDVLAYQTAEIPAYVFVTADFTTSGSGTALEAITGLTWTMPGSTALNIPFSCHLIWHQNVGNATVAFGYQDATTAATQLNAKGGIYTSATAVTQANLIASNTTTATAIVSAAGATITTNWTADLDGFIEQPSGTASVFTIRVSTTTAADTVTVKRGSFCRVG